MTGSNRAFQSSSSLRRFQLHSTTVPDDGAIDVDATAVSATDDVDTDDGLKNDDASSHERTRLKRQLLQLAASYDRGFGATTRARNEAEDVIMQLAELNPTKDAARGIDGEGINVNEDAWTAAEDEEAPLKGIWRMVWTTALDVVSLAASPIAAPAAIYQVIEPPIATNIIDFIPRVQTLFPPSIAPPSLLRAEVLTRASSREGMPERVGLLFESVKLQPMEVLGKKVDLPGLKIDFMLPQNLIGDLVQPFIDSLGEGKAGGNDADSPGFFDVEYLDDELLVIRQQAPGGVFALVKVDSYDP